MIGNGDYPGGCIGNTEVKNFTLLDEDMEAFHDFLDRCRPVLHEMLEARILTCDAKDVD